MDPLRQLSDRLDVIETTLRIALQEPEPEHQRLMLSALDRATEVVRAEHRDAENTEEKRSSLHLVRGSVRWPNPEIAGPAGHWTDQSRGHARRSAG